MYHPSSISDLSDSMARDANGRKADSLEDRGHGGMLGNDNLNENLDAFKRLIDDKLSDSGSVYLNGCKTADLAQRLSKNDPDRTYSGNKNDVRGFAFTGPIIGDGPVWIQRADYGNGKQK